MRNQSKIKDITGQQFGRFTVVEYAGNSLWVCRCSCGNTKEVRGYSLKNGDSKSCGCYNKEKVTERHKETRENVIGKTFGRLRVESVNTVSNDNTMFNCLCECGNTTLVTNSNLKSGHTQSCGCLISDVVNKRNALFRDNMVGQKFGYLVVKSFEGNVDRISRYKCLCDCGTEVSVIGTSLTRGNTLSCGCYARQLAYDRMTTHGLSHERLYQIWNWMIQRCTNENVRAYHYYGNKGISVCDEWRYDFVNFYNWALNNGYEDGLSIERENNDLNYEPSNCRWVPLSEQSRNRSIVKLSLSDAEKIRSDIRPQMEIARDYGVCQPTISAVKLNKIWKP